MQIKGIYSNHFLRNEEINRQREFPADVLLTPLFLIEFFRQDEKAFDFPMPIMNYFGMVHNFLSFQWWYCYMPLRACAFQRHPCTNRNFI